MMAYEELILKILTGKEWLTTNEIKKEVEKALKKNIINWHTIHRALTRLESNNKVQKIEKQRMILWKKK